MDIPEKIMGIMKSLEGNGYQAYIVGGAVRDIILGREPKDYDIFTNASGQEILTMFPQGKVLGGKERQEKILTVIVDGTEVSQYRNNGKRTETGSDLMQHIFTCDFTINALAMNSEQTIFDFVEGQKHLKEGLIKFVGNPQDRIDEDGLRILRNLRFKLKYGFRNHLDTFEALNANKDKLNELPPERIKEELFKILIYPEAMMELLSYGFLDIIFPEFKRLKGMEGGKYHREYVDDHCFMSHRFVAQISNNPLLCLTAFLHDIGKGIAKKTEVKDGQIHFYQHETIGEDISRNIARRLKFSKDEENYMAIMIRQHMYGYKAKPSKKSYIRFFKILEDNKIPIEDYIMLIYADHQSNLRKPRMKFGDFIRGNWLHKKYYEIKYSQEPMSAKDLAINGNDVMEICSVQGKGVGDILNEIFDKVMEGELPNKRPELIFYLKGRKKDFDFYQAIK